MMGKPWEMMGKPWEMMGKPWEMMGKTMGKGWEHDFLSTNDGDFNHQT